MISLIDDQPDRRGAKMTISGGALPPERLVLDLPGRADDDVNPIQIGIGYHNAGT